MTRLDVGTRQSNGSIPLRLFTVDKKTVKKIFEEPKTYAVKQVLLYGGLSSRGELLQQAGMLTHYSLETWLWLTSQK